jgi:hypothetical protein
MSHTYDIVSRLEGTAVYRNGLYITTRQTLQEGLGHLRFLRQRDLAADLAKDAQCWYCAGPAVADACCVPCQASLCSRTDCVENHRYFDHDHRSEGAPDA